MLDRLGALPDLKKAILIAAGFPDPDAVLLAAAKGLGSKTSDAKYARVVVAKRLAARRAESLAAADLAAALPEPDIAVSTGESPGPSEERFRTPTATRTRVEGSGVKRGRTQRRASSLDPLGLLERIHGEILAGNHPLAAETVRLGTPSGRSSAAGSCRRTRGRRSWPSCGQQQFEAAAPSLIPPQ